MHFQLLPAAAAADGGVVAEARHAAQPAERACGFDDEHARQGVAVRRQMDVGGGAAQRAAEFAPVFDAAAEHIAVAEYGFRFFQTAFLQGQAHGGAAGAAARNQYARRALGGEIRLRLQQGEIPRPAAAETEIVAHQQIARVKFAPQHGVDKAFGGHLRESAVEAQHAHGIDAAALAQQAQLVAQRREARRRFFACKAGEKLGGLRLEQHNGAAQAARGGFGFQPLQDVQMAEVDAVEIADGDGGRSGFRRQAAARKNVHVVQGGWKKAAIVNGFAQRLQSAPLAPPRVKNAIKSFGLCFFL
ncbi:hypothetical protein HMPREF9120_01844 [Neisseria sp. oral taxon 020 str. F0370]|nr:hypothetical protein HMPREF9120_01844 [Neisseria sp. oral taxon 020 str. F0370]